MAKMYKKSELTLVEGRLVSKDNEVINLSPSIIRQANDLETLVQKARYLKAQPEEQPAPSLDGFERKTEKGLRKFEADTPIMDSKVNEAIEFMKELEGTKEVQLMNEMLERYDQLYEFVRSENVFADCMFPVETMLDTPTLGNVLDWTPDTIVESIAYAFGYGVDDE